MSLLLRSGFVLLGIALLGAVAWSTDLRAVAGHLKDLGLAGAACVLAVYAAAFLFDTAAWMATIVSRRMSLSWLCRLWEIRVIGEAARPVALPYREGMSVLDVMIQAGGLTRYAAGNSAEIIRRETVGGPAEVIPVRLSDLLRDGDISQDLPMRPGDTLVIPQGWF